MTRQPAGKMLAATAGLSLYYLPTGTCGTGCQGIWPPLGMPTGPAAVPAGVACLGTVTSGQQRPVTYSGHRLCAFNQ